MGDIFLSASVPNPKSENFVGHADTVAITSAVTALAYLALGRKRIVWGGHPAITPMVASVARSLETDYTEWTKLYQSLHFIDHFPEDNDELPNVILVERGDDLSSSLEKMRRIMFSENEFDCAIFIGGMRGILDEHTLLNDIQAGVPCYPIASTGGAARELFSMCRPETISSTRLKEDLDYIPLFREITGIAPNERRHKTDKGYD